MPRHEIARDKPGLALRFADGMAQRRGEQCPPWRLADTLGGIVTDHVDWRPFKRNCSGQRLFDKRQRTRSEEHTSELQSLMRISYAVFCLKQKNHRKRMVNHSPTLLTRP